MKSVRSAALIASVCTLSCAPEAPGTDLAGQTDAILNGHAATAGEQWGTVGLLAQTDSEGWSCTGTLLAPRLIVTAAHCVTDEQGKPAELQVIAGPFDLFQASAEQTFEVKRSVAHERAFAGPRSDDASGLGQENDIAIIETVKPVQFARPVPVLSPDRLGEVLVDDTTQLTIAGYGVTSLADLDNPDSPTTHNVGTATFVRRSSFEILAGTGETESDTCVGDSGGPAYVTLDGQVYLVGATSRGREDSSLECGAGGIYTLVPAYLDWIEEHAPGLLDGSSGDGASGDGSSEDGSSEDGSSGDGSSEDGSSEDGADGDDAEGDGGVTPPTNTRRKKSGCDLSPGSSPSAPLFALFALAGLVARRRRRA